MYLADMLSGDVGLSTPEVWEAVSLLFQALFIHPWGIIIGLRQINSTWKMFCNVYIFQYLKDVL